jgi:hypothetical protein
MRFNFSHIIILCCAVFVAGLLSQIVWRSVTYTPPKPIPKWQHLITDMDDTEFYYETSNLHKDEKGNTWIRIKSVDPESWSPSDCKKNCPSYQIIMAIIKVDCAKNKVSIFDSRYYDANENRVWNDTKNPYFFRIEVIMNKIKETACRVK